jgi:hypothetical protein
MWLEDRKQAARLINPESAEVTFEYGQVTDPYGLRKVRPVYYCVGRNYFVRNPGDDLWVSDRDLPQATRERLWKRLGREPLDNIPF